MMPRLVELRPQLRFDGFKHWAHQIDYRALAVAGLGAEDQKGRQDLAPIIIEFDLKVASCCDANRTQKACGHHFDRYARANPTVLAKVCARTERDSIGPGVAISRDWRSGKIIEYDS
jgi:hypothetical protein